MNRNAIFRSLCIFINRKLQIHSFLIIVATGLLVACSGDDKNTNSESSARVVEQSINDDDLSEEAPTQDTDDEVSEVIGQNLYSRPYEYSHMVNLPLQFVEMSTGKKLSVRVTLPANEKGVPASGPFPVILTQSGYNTNLMSLMFMGMPGNLMLGAPDYFMVKRGYAQVAVDALGTGASEGGWELFGEEEQIGFADMVDWVHEQEWSNGKLGVAGVSYMAISSLFAAQRRPDSIHAVFASLPMGDAMRGIVGTGGTLNTHFMRTWMYITHTAATQNVPAMLAYPKQMNQLIRSTQQHVENGENYLLPLVDDALWNESYVTYDGEFWRTRSPLENIDNIKAPTFIFGALDDLFQRDEPLLYEALKKNGVDARLVIYNGAHMLNFLTSHIGNEQVPPIDYIMLQWFDRYLRDMETGVENIPQVVQHVKNYPTDSTPEQFRNDSFVTATDWPHPLAKAERWYFHGDLSLSQTMPDQQQQHYMTNPPGAVGGAHLSDGLVVFEMEINDGTVCSRSYEQWILGLVFPKTCYDNTANTEQQRIVFETGPMEEDYFINGPIQADVWIESTVSEAVVNVQIESVSKKQSQPISNGMLLASVRAVDEERSRFMDGEMIQPFHYLTEEKAEPLVPGEVVKMQIEVFPTSAIIPKGNKLRVAVSPSNQAQGILNYPRQEQAAGGVTTIHISPDYPSSVVLPIVPTSALN